MILSWTAESADKSKYSYKRAPYDRNAMRYGHNVGAFREHIRDIANRGALPWNLDVHRHCTSLQNWLRKEAQEWFPAPKRVKRKVYLKEETWQYIIWQREVKAAFKKCTRRCRRPWLKAAFAASKDSVGGTARTTRFTSRVLSKISSIDTGCIFCVQNRVPS